MKILVEHEKTKTKELESKCELEMKDWRHLLLVKKKVRHLRGSHCISV